MSRTCTILTCLLIAALALPATAQEEKKKTKKKTDQASEIEQQWAKLAQPGPQHQEMQRLVGRWTAEVKIFHGPGEPQVSEGTAVFRSLLGGRFVEQNFQSTMAGQPFRGIGVSGYDNAKQKYVGTWMDTMSTGIMTTSGEYDEKTHKFTETGASSSPMGEMKFKMVTHYIDNDKFLFTMYQIQDDGAEQKMMEIDYTRAAPAEKKKKKKEQ